MSIMRRLISCLLLAASCCAIAGDVTYKPPTAGPTATIRLSAPEYVGSNLLRTASLSMIVQRVELASKKCQAETLGWIAYQGKEKTYAITCFDAPA